MNGNYNDEPNDLCLQQWTTSSTLALSDIDVLGRLKISRLNYTGILQIYSRNPFRCCIAQLATIASQCWIRVWATPYGIYVVWIINFTALHNS